jgi:hypothetical protein
MGEVYRALDSPSPVVTSFARGAGMTLAIYRQMDFESLRGFTSFGDLMKRKG